MAMSASSIMPRPLPPWSSGIEISNTPRSRNAVQVSAVSSGDSRNRDSGNMDPNDSPRPAASATWSRLGWYRSVMLGYSDRPLPQNSDDQPRPPARHDLR